MSEGPSDADGTPDDRLGRLESAVLMLSAIAEEARRLGPDRLTPEATAGLAAAAERVHEAARALSLPGDGAELPAWFRGRGVATFDILFPPAPEGAPARRRNWRHPGFTFLLENLRRDSGGPDAGWTGTRLLELLAARWPRWDAMTADDVRELVLIARHWDESRFRE